jgi:hypothetical protein
VVVAALATAAPSAAQGQLFYNGEFNGVDGLASERNTSIAQAMTYDNFVVTGSGWTVTGLFGDFLTDVASTVADYEIRSGVSAGNGGMLLFSGAGVIATQVATGRSGFGYTEYRTTISGLNFFLAPGAYWMGISLVGSGSGSGRAFVSTTSGTNGVNPVTDATGVLNSSTFAANFAVNLYGEDDFAYGINGTQGPQDVVPEPATMTLLATGLAGMAAARRRKTRAS